MMNSDSYRPLRRARNRLLLPGLLAACAVLAGCQYMPFMRDEPQSEVPAEQSPDSEATQDANRSPVQRAIALLQDGREAQAQRLLEDWVAREGGDATARLLLAQIRQPPSELLGEAYDVVTVQPGDSLSEIAGRTMNNELMFYALARLNGIEVPRLLRAGQELRVPRLDLPEDIAATETPESEPAESGDSDAGSEQSVQAGSEGEGAELIATARRLMGEGRASQAYALLLSAARAGKLDASHTAMLGRAAAQLAAEACASDNTDRAMEILNQAAPWVSESDPQSEFQAERRHLEARMLLDDAESALQRGDDERAYDQLLEATALSADLAERHGPRVERLTDALSMRFHDRAFSAWRDQRVADAILLWERVTNIAPEFIPAQRYLERARQAKRELESLDD